MNQPLMIGLGEVDFDRSLWRPPSKLTLSQWAAKSYYLSAESAADEGRFRPYPYQIEIMDALTDPDVEQVTWMKSARVGATKVGNAWVGYSIDQDPCPFMVCQPTVEDAQGYSKEEIAPMLRDCPDIARKITATESRKDASDTILHKTFRGGSLSMGGANSGRFFRRVSRRRAMLDEVDGYPLSAGDDGDQIALTWKRLEHYHDRCLFIPSTPLIEGTSRVKREFLAGDQRFFEVPCPHCGYFDKLIFTQSNKGGHWMRWPKGEPEKAHFVCFDCGCEIHDNQKRKMIDAGKWVPTQPLVVRPNGRRHQSYHIWAAYSYSPNAHWGTLASEFVEANKQGAEMLKTVINTLFGETWQEQGDAPDYDKLFNRREQYAHEVPAGVLFLTCGVDVQTAGRMPYEVVGWGAGGESWSIECGTLFGEIARPEVWAQLDEMLERSWESSVGPMKLKMMAVDSSNDTQIVYNWCRKHQISRVIAVKGITTAKALVNPASNVDVKRNGKTTKRGYKIFPVNVDIAKAELYGRLKLTVGDDGMVPSGFCHFPMAHPMEFFKEITAEHLVAETNNRGFLKPVWKQLPGRENHFLDCRNYARACASLLGIDRIRRAPEAEKPQVKEVNQEEKQDVAPAEPAKAPKKRPKKKRSPGGFVWGRNR